MIEVVKSTNADSRSADPNAGIEELRHDTELHIGDVAKGLKFLGDLLESKGEEHDHTKLQNMEEFNAALKSGHIKDTPWYQKHISSERHHLKAHVPEDVNLLDVLEHLTDCTMAGLTRSGTIYDVDIPADVLVLAAQNTVELLKQNIRVVEVNNTPQDVGMEPAE